MGFVKNNLQQNELHLYIIIHWALFYPKDGGSLLAPTYQNAWPHMTKFFTVINFTKTNYIYWPVSAHSNTDIMGLNPTRSMNVCIVCIYSVFVLFCMEVEALLISHSRSPTDCVLDQETEKAGKAQQRAVPP
jgi:hypothetical protein